MRPGRAAVRQTAKVPKSYQTAAIPSPTLGLVANANLAAPPPGGALILENFLPTATSAILRRGSEVYTRVGDLTETIVSLFTYVNGNNESMFAATESGIYDASSVTDQAHLADEDGVNIVDEAGNSIIPYISSVATPAIDGFSSGEWSVVQFATSGGIFLRAVNGLDTPLVYDGTDWGTSPAITGTDLSPEDLICTWPHQGRLWFAETETLNAWYLPTAQIGGTAVIFPMGGVFSLGGSLLFGSTWSLETGAGGPSEYNIFVTTEGEVAVYRGSDPTDADSWSKVGIYRIGKPLGPKAYFRAGGDIVIATDIGLIPLSEALQKDIAVLAPAAVSAPIDAIWNEEVQNRYGAPWRCAVWSAGQMAIVLPPTINNQQPVMYVANSRTGKWGKFTGWDGTCLCVFRNRLFFGSKDGRVVEGNVTGLDQGAAYTGTYVPLFSDFGEPGVKTIGMARAVVRATSRLSDKLSMHGEFNVTLPSPPGAASVYGANTWGGGVWGVATWGSAAGKNSFSEWRSTPFNGNAIAPSLQVTSGSLVPLDAEILRIDLTYLSGEVII